jgi:hypothetical protein
MYGSHLAINHLVLTEGWDIQIASELLDQSIKNYQPDDMNKYKRLHLHCWHSHVPFSKFDFKRQRYNHIDPNSLINDTSAQAYVRRKINELVKISFL